jgi:hypothetical protein
MNTMKHVTSLKPKLVCFLSTLYFPSWRLKGSKLWFGPTIERPSRCNMLSHHMLFPTRCLEPFGDQYPRNMQLNWPNRESQSLLSRWRLSSNSWFNRGSGTVPKLLSHWPYLPFVYFTSKLTQLSILGRDNIINIL